VHVQDIAIPLNVHRTIPEGTLRTVLDTITGARSLKHFGIHLSEVQLEADDVDWQIGGGAVVRGHAQDLLMVVCGRRMPHGRLSGPTADRLTIG